VLPVQLFKIHVCKVRSFKGSISDKRLGEVGTAEHGVSEIGVAEVGIT
jgi:hypothetical protein